VEDLLDLKRLSVGKMRLFLASVDLAAVVRQTVEDLRPLFVQRGLLLALDIQNEPLWVDGDAVRLSEVMANLLQNAAKFTDAGGHVSVWLEERDGKARVVVKDNGVGIAPELLSTLFDPFVQGEQTLARSRAGLGLGLALVRGIVDLHGGSVSVRSNGAGTGTEFQVQLPVAEAPAATVPKLDLPAAAVARRRVLVIEDNEDAAASLRDVVELAGGHEVFVAHDGAEGVTVARLLRPEVILCDLGLPTMDGYEVARQLRASGDASWTTLVAVSGYAAADDVERVAEAGFKHHLAKPADIETLLRIIAEAPSHT
jgi:CheY-like chemotaxis protein